LESFGNRVHVVKLTFWHSIEHRARELDERLKNVFPGEKINLLGHSMGGLDIRYFTSVFDKGERVASVTTIGTPNKGTAIADHFLELFLGDVIHKTEALALKLKLSHQGFKQVSKEHHKIFTPHIAC